VFYPVLEFREKKQTFAKIKGDNVDFFLDSMPDIVLCKFYTKPFNLLLMKSSNFIVDYPCTITWDICQFLQLAHHVFNRPPFRDIKFSESLANAHAYPSCYLEDLKAKKNT
jgi:hypothetical protein